MRKKFTILLVILLFVVVVYNLIIVTLNYFKDAAIIEKINRPEHKIGIAIESEFKEEIINGLKDGMFDLGYSENKNIFYYEENINSEINVDTEVIFSKLSDHNIDLVYTVSAPLTAELRAYFKDKPIVFNIAVSPTSAGFTESYSSSGSNLTGFTSLADELAPKRVEIFKDSFPGINRITIFYNPANKFVMPVVINTRQAAKKIGIELQEKQVTNDQNLALILTQISPGQTDGFFIVSDPIIINNISLLIEHADALRIPTIADTDKFIKKGATMSYGENYYEMGKRSALSVYKILNGYKPKQLPIETPSKLELVVNLKNLRKNNLNVDSDIINLVSRFVE